MKFTWIYEDKTPVLLRTYLKHLTLPNSFIKWIKREGRFMINDQPVTVRHQIQQGDQLDIVCPLEQGHDTVVPTFEPIEVVYEDDHLLIVKKPAGVISIPSVKDPKSSMANRIKGYYVQQDYDNQVIHIVTRLDRQTSGLMLIAKHRLAHAWLDRQILQGTLDRIYTGISSRGVWPKTGIIDAPIGRDEVSIITRRVTPTGKPSQTSYRLLQELKDSALLEFKLHTGRTHQIRVHTQYMGGPLVGDDLYGGPVLYPLTRQGLHCSLIRLIHPFTMKPLEVTIPLADDMKQWIQLHQIRNGV